MDRRTYLTSTALAATTAMAGCSAVFGGDVSLGDPETATEDGGTEKILTYRHDGDPVATLNLDQRSERTTLSDPFDLRLSVSHPDSIAIESFRFSFLAPPASTEPSAEIYLQPPGGENWPNITFRTTEEGRTVVAADGIGGNGPGRSTLTLAMRVAPTVADVEELALHAEMTLAGDGTTYTIDERTRFQPVTDSP